MMRTKVRVLSYQIIPGQAQQQPPFGVPSLPSVPEDRVQITAAGPGVNLQLVYNRIEDAPIPGTTLNLILSTDMNEVPMTQVVVNGS